MQKAFRLPTGVPAGISQPALTIAGHPAASSEWRIPQLMVGAGGMILAVSGVLFFVQMIMTLRSKKKALIFRLLNLDILPTT